MTERRLILCDVFTSVPMLGNGLAVILDGNGVTTHDMQRFANWINLPETAYLADPKDASADYSLRIFTPDRELPFAGHPTIGSAAAWLRAGGQPRTAGKLRQECGIGMVDIDICGMGPAFVAPPTRISPMPPDRRRSIETALKIDPATVLHAVMLDNGSTWATLELKRAEDVLAVDAERVRDGEGGSVALVAATPESRDRQFEVRMLSPSATRCEDPVTGSLMAALAVWLHRDGRCAVPAVAVQGTRLGRAGRVHITPDPKIQDRILIGGDVQFISDGRVDL